MTEFELFEEFKIVKDVDDNINNLKVRRDLLVKDFLKKLPYQKGDLVEDNFGDRFIIDKLIDAEFDYANHLYIKYTAYKVKKNGEPYVVPRNYWSIGDYFSLKKVYE